MIIPIRCFTCGKVLADKWRAFQKRCEIAAADKKQSNEDEDATLDQHPFFYDNEPFVGGVMDDLGIDRICCRRHFLTQVDLVDII